jgi:NAD(P)-dependent dehydrogenase (short-subunit alcohol dehydrogenase family)
VRLSPQKSIRQLAAAIGRDHPRLDVLVNNAGGVSAHRMVTVDGLRGRSRPTTLATSS